MKKVLLLLFFSVLQIFSAQEENILKVMANQQIAWNAGNLDQFMQGYWNSEEMMFIGKSGPNYGWQKTLDNYKKSYPTKEKMGTLSFTDQKIKMLGKDYAQVFGKWHLQRTEGDLGGIYTLIFQKFKNGWKIISDHTE
ncbi:YybH family protein [Frigoriflavimonas asaccharolytica]|uniref:Ketosteroid isomerase-like protein n=1 Tax=Frigoriflavimonas asaccharolytica TaxID=2735899 RepID=A0A8J8G8M1_9FLAO|nr:nuclear transport factor 2 family protein [Frigoriflavimonas asaccharolytica]NRS93341.1 ketosteroid isomerase-like protein [Frigoriflavimonas asaccharolytica]